jgi:hypothetical protein
LKASPGPSASLSLSHSRPPRLPGPGPRGVAPQSRVYPGRPVIPKPSTTSSSVARVHRSGTQVAKPPPPTLSLQLLLDSESDSDCDVASSHDVDADREADDFTFRG